MNKISNFAKQVIARAKGDTAALIAAKNELNSNTAIESQLAALRGGLSDEQTKLADAKEVFEDAKYPATYIVPKGVDTPSKYRQNYVTAVVNAQENVRSAEDAVKATQETIDLWISIQAEGKQQVDAPEEVA